MVVEKRALYNLLRMNWINEPTLDVEPWQVQDYRILHINELFHTLRSFGIDLDQYSFAKLAEKIDSPEELTTKLLEGSDLEPPEQDQVYLLLFELWRRQVPEKLTLSIFCDELDYQIFLYDKGDLTSDESIQDAIANLEMILDENVDQGVNPIDIFNTISENCANDLENFLYDFIAEQIDNDNLAYAIELVDGLGPYLKNSKWFDLLRVRILEQTDPEAAQENLKKLVQKATRDEDLSFNLEILSFIVQGGQRQEFAKIVRKTSNLLKTEEDFLDLAILCGDYFRLLDEDQKEQAIQGIIDQRSHLQPSTPIDPKDEDLSKLLKTIR